MARRGKPVKINLTPEQRAQIKEATGADVEGLEVTAGDATLSPEELEERVAPATSSEVKVVVKGTFVF